MGLNLGQTSPIGKDYIPCLDCREARFCAGPATKAGEYGLGQVVSKFQIALNDRSCDGIAPSCV